MEILKVKGCSISNDDMELIMKRYDKNNDGKITLSEFLKETIPNYRNPD